MTLRFVLITVFLIVLSHAQASTTNTWQGTTNVWATASNWSQNRAPISTDDVVFNNGATNFPAIPSGAVANSLTMNGSYTLLGGDLTLTTGKINVATGIIATDQTTILAGTAGLTLNTGTGSAGTLIVETANTYTGITTISNGTLFITANVGASGNSTVGNSSTIVLGDASTTNFNGSPALSGPQFGTVARNITVGNFLTSGTYSLPAIGNITGNVTISQPLTILNGTKISGNITSGAGTQLLTFGGAGGFTTVSGIIGDGSGKVAILITNGVTLSGTNTFTGGVTLNGGTLEADSSAALGAVTNTLTINGGSIISGPSATVSLAAYPTIVNADFSIRNIILNGTMSLGTASGTSRTVTATGSPSLASTIHGVISNGTTATSLIKAGTGKLSLEGNNTFSGGVTLNAGTLGIGAPGTLATNSALGTGTFTINGGGIDNTAYPSIDLSGTTKNVLAINADFSFTGGLLNLSGGNSTLGAGAGTSRTLFMTAGELVLGTMANGTTANSLIIASGSLGTLDLAGNSTFTGGVTLNAGGLNINSQGTSASNSGLGTGPLVISGGTLGNSSGGNIDLTGTTNNAVTINGNFIFAGAQNLTLGTGATTLGTAAGTGRTVTVSNGALGLGSIANGTTANSLTLAGSGVLTLAGNSTFTGTTTINAGKLTLTGTMASPSINITFGTTFDIQATGANPAAPGRLSDSAVITLSGGVLSMEANATTNCTETIGSLNFTAGPPNTIILAANGAFNCQLTAGGSVPTLSAGASVNLIREAVSTGTANLFFSGQATDVAAPIAGYTVNGQTAKYDATGATGLAPSSTTNTFITKQNGNWSATTTWLNGAVPTANDMIVIRHNVTVDTTSRTTQAVLFDQGVGSLLATTDKLTNTSGLCTVLNSASGTGSATESAVLAGASLIKNGPGTLILSGANSSYTGPIVVNGGILQAGSTTAFGTNSAVTLANTAGVLMDITGFNISIGSLTGGGAAGGNLNLGVQTLTIGGDSTSPGPYAGIISDGGGATVGGNLIKTGTGTLTLSGVNTYNGTTTINGGVLSIGLLDISGSPSGIGTGFNATNFTNLIIGNGTLQYTGPSVSTDHFIVLTNATVSTFDVTSPATTLSLTSAISNPTTTGGLTKVGAGTLALLSTASAYTGVTKISAGTLSAGYIYNGGTSDSSIGASSSAATNLVMDGGILSGQGNSNRNFTVTAGKTATFDVPAATSLVLAGSAATSGNLVKTGGGTLNFTGAQLYTGTTIVNGGSLQITGNTGAIASSPTITVNAGATLDFNSVGATAEPASPGRVSDTALVTLNGGTLSMEAGTSASRLETIGTLAFSPGTANTVILIPNGSLKCQLTVSSAGGALPTLSAGTTVNLIRGAGNATGTANLFFNGQSTNIASPISGYTVNSQAAKYDATTPLGLVQSSGNIIATAAAGNWGTAATWLGGAVPAAGDTVLIHHAVTLEAAHTAQAVIFDNVGAGSLVTSNESPLTNTTGVFSVIDGVTAQVDVPVAGTSFTLNGANGTLNLTDTSTYTGTTTINNGVTLRLGLGNFNFGTISSGPVVNDGTLAYSGGIITQLGNDLSGSGALSLVEDLTSFAFPDVTLTGNNTLTGAVSLMGNLHVGNGGTTGNLGSGPISGDGNSNGSNNLLFNRSDTVVVPNSIGNYITVQQSGSGTLILTGPLDPTANLRVNSGTANINSGGPNSINAITMFGGTFNLQSGTSLNMGNAVDIYNGSATIASGASLMSTNNSSFVANTGNLTVNGSLMLGGIQVLNSATMMVSAGGSVSGPVQVINNGTFTVNGTCQSVNLNNSSVNTPASTGCLLRGTGTAGTIVASDTNRNAVVWPGLAKTVGALTSNEQMNADSVDLSSGGKFAVVVRNAGGFSQKLVVTNGVNTNFGESVFSFATDTTPATPTSYTVLSCTNGAINYTFFTLDAPPGFTLGTHYNLRYSISGSSPLLHSALGPGAVLPAGYNQVDLVFTGTSVTPVTVTSFTARAEGAGVRLDWHCISEFQNAGFHLYRRSIDEPRPQGSGWTRVNPALIAGRITNPDAKLYQFYDWAEPGVCEYKLESVSIQGSHETYRDIAGPVVVDSRRDTFIAAESINVAMASVAQNRRTALRAVDSAQSGDRNVAVPTVRTLGPDDLVVQAACLHELNGASSDANASRDGMTSRDRKGAGGCSFASAPLTINSAAAARWFSAKTPSTVSSYTAAKIVYSTPGVLLIPQSMLPAGFDANHVAIQREGRALTALAKTSAGLLVFGEGYQDDYTDKDALFLRSIGGATAAGTLSQTSGLFTSTLPVNTQAPMTASAEFHDVYFDFNLRPYNYPPWFSSQYLADGTDQSFSINAPNATCGAGSLIVNLWSLTQDHTLQVAVNGQPIGQAQWSGVGQMIQLTFQIPSGVLNAGANQIELITPAVNGDAGQIAFLHSMTLSYTQTLDGSQPLTINNLSGQSALYEVGNVQSANAWVVDTRFSDRAALVPYEAEAQADGTFRIRFIGSAGRTGRFLVVPAGQEHLPDSVTKSAVKPLRAAPYLAVGPSQFSSAVEPLLMQRSKEGLRSAFVDQEQIFDYYNYGRYGPIGIQNAVRSTRPQYLLLLGRTTYDYRNYSGANVDPLCPTFLVPTSFWAQATSDSLFGDLGRGYPEVAVGRLPVNDASELSSALRHVLSNNGAPMSGVRVHAATDRADPAVADFPAQAAALAQTIPDMAWQANYLGVTYQTDVEVTAAMTSAANELADWIVYIGHGNALHLGSANNVILDTGSVQNWTGHAVFLQCTCAGNWMAKDEQNYHSLAIQALTQPQGGISASIGTSTYMNSDCAVEFASQLLKNANTSSMRWGTALMRTQQWAFTKGSSYYSDLNKTEQIFGDPAMPVLMRAPAEASKAPVTGQF